MKTRYESVDNGGDLVSPSRNPIAIHAFNTGHFTSATPGPSFSTETQQQASERRAGKQVQSRKRPYSSIEEPHNTPPSFGYVTNRGKHRCALCTTELPSADILRKHESLSELHRANLKDPTAVSRGHAALAERQNLSETAVRQQSRPNPALSNSDGFVGRYEAVPGQQFEQREESSTPHQQRLGSTLTGNENDAALDTIQVAEPRRGRLEHSPQSFNGDDYNGERQDGPAPDVEIFEHFTKGRKSRPAQTIRRNQSAAPEAQLQAHVEGGVASQQQGRSAAENKRSRNNPPSEDVQPTWIAQSFLSSAMELLAKKCIEDHPELKDGFYKCIQDMQASHNVGVSDMQDVRLENAAKR